MAIDTCIQFINGKEVGGAAFPASADRIDFDNTGTGLSATKVQGAIEEVNGKVDDLTASVSVTADGVKTYATLLAELLALIDGTKVTTKSAIYIQGLACVYQISVVASSGFIYGASYISASKINCGSVYLLSNLCAVYGKAEGSTNTDYSSNVPTNNTKITLYY